MKAYSKRTERALMRKEKHRVIMFGRKTRGSIELNINLISIPQSFHFRSKKARMEWLERSIAFV